MPSRFSVAQMLKRFETNWPDVWTPESELIIAIMRMNDLIQEDTQRVMAQFNLSLTAFEVLITLRSLAPPRIISPTDLYKAAMVSSGGMTKVLKTLESRGAVRRLENSDDRRSKLVQLTDDGVCLAEQVAGAVVNNDTELMRTSLSPDDLAHLRTALLQALGKLEDDMPDTDGPGAKTL